MTGFELMTSAQREEWADLQERCTHSGTMRFSLLDAAHLAEYEQLAARLEIEHRREQTL